MQPGAFFKRFHIAEFAALLSRAFRRFPVATLFALASFVTIFIENHGNGDLQWLKVTVPGFVFSAAAEMYGEARGLPPAARALGAWGGGVLMVVTGALMTGMGLETQALWWVALVLFFIAAPYLRRTGTEESFWYYNYQHFLVFAAGFASALVLVLGVVAIASSVEYLFEIKFYKRFFADVWAFGFTIFLPVYFLSNLPEKFDYESQECSVPKACAFIANYLLVPLCLTYAFVLYAYMAKIALMAELPRGNLAYMVTSFGVIGVLTHLVVFPMRDTGAQLLQQFYRHFYKIMVAPVLLLGLGIYTRISQYGVTEDRYLLVVCLIWLACLCALYAFFPRKVHLKYVPIILCVLMLIGAVSPFNADIVSTVSQKQRLEKLLAKAGVIRPDGGVGKAQDEVSFEDSKQITSIVEYFQRYGKRKRKSLQPWVLGGIPEHGYSAKSIVEGWGITYTPRWKQAQDPDSKSLSLTSRGSGQVLKVAPYHFFLPVAVYMSSNAQPEPRSQTYKDENGNSLPLTYGMSEDGTFSINVNGKAVAFALAPVVAELSKTYTGSVPDDKADLLMLRKNENGVDAMLRLKSVNYEQKAGTTRFTSVTLDLYFTPAP